MFLCYWMHVASKCTYCYKKDKVCYFLFQLPSQSRNEIFLPTSQSMHCQSHPQSVFTRHQPRPVTATASVPTTSLEYENTSSLSTGPHTMNPLMYRREWNRPGNSSHFRYSMYGDHGVSSMPYTSSTQHKTLSYDPVQREKQATSVWTCTISDVLNVLYSRMSCCSSFNIGCNSCVYSTFSIMLPSCQNTSIFVLFQTLCA